MASSIRTLRQLKLEQIRSYECELLVRTLFTKNRHSFKSDTDWRISTKTIVRVRLGKLFKLFITFYKLLIIFNH